MTRRYDIAIAGGGATALALALALHRQSDGALSIAICDPALAAGVRPDARALALVAGARRFLDTLGVWPALAAESQPIEAMEITDSGLSEPVRPTLLTFEGAGDGAPFAHMVPAHRITEALLGAVRDTAIALLPVKATVKERSAARVMLEAGDEQITAALLVAADGKASPIRTGAGLSFYGWDYGQTGIVATIEHSLPHRGTAIEHFLPSGPFALLPLPGQASSIVWSETTESARRYLAMDPVDLIDQIERRAGGRFGTIRALRDVAGFPLSFGLARRFGAERLVLLGDAAHVLHPIAGQGLNYGLRGAAALATAILDAARLGLDVGDGAVLAAYEAARRPDVVAMAVATDGLNRLFSNDIGPVRAVRDLGLGLVERMPGLKRWFIAQAAGDGALAPGAFRS